MRRSQLFWLSMSATVVFIVVGSLVAVQAQNPNAWTNGRVNVRNMPRAVGTLLTTFDDSTLLFLEGRTEDLVWILGRSANTGQRGWMSSSYLRFAVGFQPGTLPVSKEIINGSAAAVVPGSTAIPLTGNATATYIPTAYAPSEVPSEIMGADHLRAPILPIIDAQMHATLKRIYARGQQLGNDPAVFSKVGDCMTDAYFLNGLGNGNYMLGPYASLLDTVKYYLAPVPGTSSNSFTVASQASYSGLTANTVLSDEFTSVKGAGVCQSGESMLLCEYRVHKPSVSVIMLGFSETQLMQVQDFDTFLRRIVQDTVDRGVIPVLTTFPENQFRKQVSRLMNKAIVDIAGLYHVPLINLDRALYALPNHGVDNLSHLTLAPFGTSVFTGEGLRYGMNMRALLTLQTLSSVSKDLQKP